MKYVVVYLLRGKVQEYHEKLMKEVGPKFGEDYMIKNPIPAHITLKSPFYLKNVNVLERTLKSFVRKYKPSRIEIRDFGNFDRFVSFLKIKFSKESKTMHKRLLKELTKISGVELREFDINFKPHATIAYGNKKQTFDKIWEYLNKLNKPHFNLKFDNLTILKKPRKFWKIHKIFEIR